MGYKKLKALGAGAIMAFSAAACSAPPVSPTDEKDDTQKIERTLPDVDFVSENKEAMSCPVPTGTRNGRIYIERSCVTLARYMDDPNSYKDFAGLETLDDFRHSSSLAADFLRRASEGSKRFCDMELSKRVAAVHTSSRIGIDFGKSYRSIVNTLNFGHELMHHIQDQNGSDSFAISRPMYENQVELLVMETAAPAIEIALLYEGIQNGNTTWSTQIKEGSIRAQLLEMMEVEYNTARSQGESHSKSLEAGTTKVWQYYLTKQSKLDHYNKNTLRFTLTYMDQMTSIDPRKTTSEFNEILKRAGHISDEFSFVDPTLLPVGDERFGDNNEIKEMFAVVDWHRHKKVYGENDNRTKMLWGRMVAENNRYRNVDIESVICSIKGGMDVSRAFNDLLDPIEIENTSQNAVINTPARRP